MNAALERGNRKATSMNKKRRRKKKLIEGITSRVCSSPSVFQQKAKKKKLTRRIISGKYRENDSIEGSSE